MWSVVGFECLLDLVCASVRGVNWLLPMDMWFRGSVDFWSQRSSAQDSGFKASTLLSQEEYAINLE